MTTKPHIQLLKTNWFLICLFTLLLNDFILKFLFPGILTGKLSDLSGLFIFPYFFSVFFLRQKKQIYFSTAILFVFWKLSLSSILINWFNAFDIVYLKRVTDLTDLFALIVLPISYKYFDRQLLKNESYNCFQVSVICFLAFFSFCATTIGEKEYQKKIFIGKAYKINANKELLFKKIQKFSQFSTLQLSDTVFKVSCPANINKYSDNHRVFYLVSVKQFFLDTTVIIIDSVLKYEITNGGLFSGPDSDTEKYFENLSKADYEIIFGSNLLRLLRGKAKEYRPMDFDTKWSN